MKVCVVGAGAIGGLLGAKLAEHVDQLTLIARGAHLEAIQRDGLKVVMADGTELLASGVHATSDMRACGTQDLVILALKAHQIGPVIDEIVTLLGENTVVLTTQNGLPWWYFQCHGGPYDGHVIKALDPTGEISEKIDPRRIIGCIAYPAAEIAEPGLIRHVEGIRFPVGELTGEESERVKNISAMLITAGFKSPILPDIRSEIWLKAWGNLSFNPISALTHATLVDICLFPLSRGLAERMMIEAQSIAGKLDITFRVPLEKRINGAEKVGKHKTSMLQDVEVGKALEVDALVGSVVELGNLTGTPTPTISAIYEACKLLNHMLEQDKISIRSSPVS